MRAQLTETERYVTKKLAEIVLSDHTVTGDESSDSDDNLALTSELGRNITQSLFNGFKNRLFAKKLSDIMQSDTT
jgi:hypothetical protein